MKKMLLKHKNLAKVIREHLRKGLFFDKITVWRLATSSNRDSGKSVFL